MVPRHIGLNALLRFDAYPKAAYFRDNKESSRSRINKNMVLSPTPDAIRRVRDFRVRDLTASKVSDGREGADADYENDASTIGAFRDDEKSRGGGPDKRACWGDFFFVNLREISANDRETGKYSDGM